MVSGSEMADFSGIFRLIRKRMLMKQHSYCHFLNIRLPFIFQIEKYFCHEFLPHIKHLSVRCMELLFTKTILN